MTELNKNFYKRYLNVVVNVVSGYALDNGYWVQIFTNNNDNYEAIVIIENVIIFLRFAFSTYFDFEDLFYYLKVFSGEEVESNLDLDYKMMLRLGELYPRQHGNFPAKYFTVINHDLDIYDEFLEGVDPFKKEYLNN